MGNSKEDLTIVQESDEQTLLLTPASQQAVLIQGERLGFFVGPGLYFMPANSERWRL